MKIAMLEGMLNATTDFIAFTNLKGSYVEVSKTNADNWNTTRRAMIGKTDFDFMPREEAEKSWTLSQEVINTGQPVTDVVMKTLRNEKDVWYSISIYPWMDDDNNKILGVISIKRDITKRMEIEEMMRFMFINEKHDIKGPLLGANGILARVIKGKYGALDENILQVLNEIYLEYLNIELKVTESMTRTTFFRLDDGTLTLNKTCMDVREEVVNKLQRALHKKLSSGIIEIDNRLSHECSRVNTNPEILTTAFSTLINNAMNHGGQGRVCKITLACRKIKNFFIFRVSNDGPAPSADFVKNRMFRKFQRDKCSQKTSGTGIGLYAAREAVRMLGGDMWYRKIKGEPTFYFSVPNE